jgi:Alr-MurF fusion protein
MISLYDLLEASDGQLFGEPAAQLFDDFCLDVEQATANQLFVALKDEHGDTHRHIQQAIENGVSGVLCHHPPDCGLDGVSVVLVPDSVDALLAWARYILGKYGTKIIGVSGSVGKTVAVDAISRVLQIDYTVYTNRRGGEGRLSVPLALAQLSVQHQFAVLKLGTTRAGEMAGMVESVHPLVGVVMNVGELHTNQFQSPEQYAREIGVLIDSLSPSCLAVLNYDDDLVRMMTNQARPEVRTIGLTAFGADTMAYNVRTSPDGTQFDLRHGGERFSDQQIPLLGKYQLYAALAALNIGQYFGVSLENGLKALAEMKPLAGHMNPLIGRGGAVLMDDTFNAAPQSTLAALEWLESIKENYKRVFFVFGDMPVTGSIGKKGYRKIGQRAAEVVDVLVTHGIDSSVTARAALDYGMDDHHVYTTYAKQDTVAALGNGYGLGEGDLVLVKGGAASRMEQVVRHLLADAKDKDQLVRQIPGWAEVAFSTPTRLNWIEIDTDALAGNVRTLKALVGDDVAVVAVVKADGYGHGAVTAARTALLNGASHLGVSSLQDAVQLRSAGIDAPILAMNHVPVHLTALAIRQNVTLMVYDLDIARAYNRIAYDVGGRVRVHLKIDTGMGRLGVMPDEARRFLRYLMNMRYMDVEGLCTHFPSADDDPEYTAQQVETFKAVLNSLQMDTGHQFKYVHAANSAATLAHPEAHFNMVRPGIALFGMRPAKDVPLPEGFKPVLTWKTTVVQTKTLPPGHAVGYGKIYVTEGEEKIAVLPVGYADGFRRGPTPWSEVLIHGQRAPLIGRVSMEKTTIDVSHIANVAIGDEVVLLGRQGDEVITIEEVAEQLGTLNYEVTCGIMPRVPRH